MVVFFSQIQLCGVLKGHRGLCVAPLLAHHLSVIGYDFAGLRIQDLVPYMVRRQFLPPAAVEAAAQGGSPHGMRAGPGPVAVSLEQGNPEAPPDGGEEGTSRGSTAPSEENGRNEGERLVAAACARYLGSGSGLGFDDLGGVGEHGGGGGGGGGARVRRVSGGCRVLLRARDVCAGVCGHQQVPHSPIIYAPM